MKKLLHRNLAENAYQIIRNRIIGGDLGIGSPLSRRRIAEELSISPLPVMEALQKLENEGLVESRPRVGTRVRVPTSQDIRDQFVLREALETQSARLFSEKSSSDEKRELVAIADRLDLFDESMQSHGNSEGPIRIQGEIQLHMHLHLRIAECSGCAALVNALRLNQTLVFMWYLQVFPRLQIVPRWHRQLIDSISVADPSEAESAMRVHIRHGLANLLSNLGPSHTAIRAGLVNSGEQRSTGVENPARETAAPT